MPARSMKLVSGGRAEWCGNGEEHNAAAAAHGRRPADAGDPRPGRKGWGGRLPALHRAVAECGVAGGKGSSAADLATRRLKVPQKQRPRRRLWLGDGSCMRLRPERANHVRSYDFVKAMTHDGRALRLLGVIDAVVPGCATRG